MKRYIPNTITCMNLFSGCIAVVMAFKGLFFYSLLFIILAAVFDFFDGMVARMLHVSSSIGKELDSLSDMVSFGLAPSTILYVRLLLISDNSFIPYFAFLVAVFSALRLAKFNVDERQTSSFIGLPTPANALFFASLVSICDITTPMASYLDRSVFNVLNSNVYVLLLLIAIFSYLLVSEIPMFSLKFKNLQWGANKVRFIFLALSFCLIVGLQLAAFPFIILLFLVMSVVSSYKA